LEFIHLAQKSALVDMVVVMLLFDYSVVLRAKEICVASVNKRKITGVDEDNRGR
jgi:hypothetical protein